MPGQFVATLKKKIALENAIPQMPEAAMQLKKIIEDSDTPNIATLQKIILSSPALTAMALRTASSVNYGSTEPVTDVKRAIMVLGNHALYSIAVATMMQAVISEKVKAALLEPRQFVLHSTFVGITARFLFDLQIREHGHKSAYRSDEMFAAGVLHDVGMGLFAASEPVAFKKLVDDSRVHLLTLSDEYLRTFDEMPYALSANAMESWHLAQKMVDLVATMEDPEMFVEEPVTAACLVYADYLAEKYGFGLTRNVANVECPEYVRELVGVPEDEEFEITDMIGEIAYDCLPKASAA